MKKIMIQFHAELEELVGFINSSSSEFGLHLSVMILRPFALRGINGDLTIDDLEVDGDVRVFLSKEKFNIDSVSPNNFYDLNPGVVGVHIGRLSDQGLSESALAFMSDDEEKIAIANKLASRLKKITKAGAIAVNPLNGVEVAARSHRYTDGAKSLCDDGVKILPVAGNSFLKLPD